MAKVPLTLPSDRECCAMGLTLAKRSSTEPLRVARIASTMELEAFWLSEAALPDLPQSCEVLASRPSFAFTEDGSIPRGRRLRALIRRPPCPHGPRPV